MNRMNRLEPATTESFGLVAWLEQTKVSLPLKGVECRFDVTAGVASVEIDQIFHQSHAQPLDCTYTFPLPAGAAVYRCEMHVNGRVIRAKVEAREEARRIFAQQKTAGRRAALVETERDNLFTLSLGNLQPQDVVVIRFAYFQTLERIGSEQRLRIPVCPGVRYIPGRPLLRALSGRGTVDDTDQVPDASRITPPRIDALHPDAAYFCAEGTITRAAVADDSLSSPTHPVLVHAEGERYNLALAERGAVPDRDLVLRWQEPRAAALAPRAWSFAGDGECFALVQLRAPAEVGVAADFEQDVYFLIDRSGSMEGAKWEKTCEALTGFVKLLGERDRVWITLFESSFLDFSEEPMPAPRVLADRGFRALVARGTAGGTELAPAAGHVLAKIAEHSRQRAATVVLITDGQVGNEDALLQRFRRQADVTVHVFGIDTAVNDAFLKRLAAQQGGDCWLQTPNDNIAATVSSLADRLRRPVLTGLKVSGGWMPAASRLPALHAGQVIDLPLRNTTAKPIRIEGRLGSGETHTFTIDATPVAHGALELLWARERIESLLGEDKAADALKLAKRHNLLCKGAAFVAWDEKEQVPIATREIVQPSIHPMLLSSQPVLSRAFMRELVDEQDHPSIACFLDPDRDRASHSPEPKGLGGLFGWSFSEAPEPDWRGVFLKLAGDAGLSDALASGLADWADAKFRERDRRRAVLMRLLADIETCAGGLREKARLCRDFIDAHLAGERAVRARLLAVVDEWELRPIA